MSRQFVGYSPEAIEKLNEESGKTSLDAIRKTSIEIAKNMVVSGKYSESEAATLMNINVSDLKQ
jgi:hypothetical protein